MVSGALLIIQILGPEVYPNDDLEWYLPNDGVAGLTLLILASWVMTRWVDGRPFASLGVSLHPRTPLLFLFGLVMGIAVKSIALYTIGYLQADMVPKWPIFHVVHPNQAGLFETARLLVFVAVGEELFNRGYVLQAMAQRLGTAPSLAITSILFGLGHLVGETELLPAITVVITTSMIGLFLGILVVRTGSLWTAIACHWGLNLVGSEIGLRATGAASDFDPAIWGFSNNPQYWLIFGLMTLIIMFVPLSVDRKGKILWERYVRRPAWPPWQRKATDKEPT